MPYVVLLFLGNPISVESYGFSPRVAMESTTVSEYVTYLIYCMEYKACIMEEMCIDAEKKIIEKYHGKPPPGYGVLFKSCIIVDFKGLGLGHIGGDGQKMASAALKIATSYYPEMLFKSNMVCEWNAGDNFDNYIYLFILFVHFIISDQCDLDF